MNFFLDIIHRHPEIWISSIYWAQLSRAVPEDGDRFQSPKRSVFYKKKL
jgi:hypothetical protein